MKLPSVSVQSPKVPSVRVNIKVRWQYLSIGIRISLKGRIGHLLPHQIDRRTHCQGPQMLGTGCQYCKAREAVVLFPDSRCTSPTRSLAWQFPPLFPQSENLLHRLNCTHFVSKKFSSCSLGLECWKRVLGSRFHLSKHTGTECFEYHKNRYVPPGNVIDESSFMATDSSGKLPNAPFDKVSSDEVMRPTKWKWTENLQTLPSWSLHAWQDHLNRFWVTFRMFLCSNRWVVLPSLTISAPFFEKNYIMNFPKGAVAFQRNLLSANIC